MLHDGSRVSLRSPRDDSGVQPSANFMGTPGQNTVKKTPESKEHADGGERQAFAMVQNLDLLRRRLARGQYRHLRPAYARGLAWLVRVRRCARLRGRNPGPRFALRARE